PEASAQTSPRRYTAEVVGLLRNGSKLLDNGQLAEARVEFIKATQLQPECPEAYNNIGLSFYRAGDFDGASKAYLKALEIDSVFVPSITNLGVIRYKQGRLTDAVNLYKVALGLVGGKDAELQYNLANVLRDQKNYEEARQRYVEALKIKPDFYAAHNGLGATYYCLKKFDKAEKEVLLSIKLKPDYALAHYHLGLILFARGKYQEAIQSYETSLKYETDKNYEEETKQKIAYVKRRMTEEPAAAATDTSQTAAPAPKSKETEKALSLLRSQSYAPAEQELKGLVEAANLRNDPVVWNDYGFALYNQNDRKKTDLAIKAYRQSIELSSGKLHQTHYNLAQALR
ncbi:MAG: tetratricopeptide repeat protein, partial [Cyanobacteria bacterium]|nr:tetratricopeptide repeat protein [Cyanobacteriota bacterium]